MIEVRILTQKKKIKAMQASGHALFARHGKDLVCAGVSAVLIGGFNAVILALGEDSSRFQVEMGEGEASLTLHDVDDRRVQVILETLEIQLKTIEEGYSKYINVIKQEVHAS